MKDAYEDARKLGEKEYRKAQAEGQYPYLPALGSLVKDADKYAVQNIGLQDIPLEMIVGTRTEGRQNAFARNFMPLLEADSEFGQKWINLCDSAQTEGIREPIKVYEYMNRYYVQEGNKRVSVSRYLELYSIYGDVYRILPPRTDDPAVRTYYEFVEFHRASGLYTIILSHEGDYRELASLAGQTLDQKWPEDVSMSLKAAYSAFIEQYRLRNVDTDKVPEGDAFLTYAGIFGLDSLLRDTPVQINVRLVKVWNEIIANSRRGNVDLVKEPDDIEKKPTVLFPFKIAKTRTLSKELKVAIIHERNAENSSWAYQHDLGINALKDKFGDAIDVIRFNNCDTDEKADKAFEACGADQTSLVFADSAALMNSCVRAALDYPMMDVMNCSINLKHSVVPSYYIRKYEAKFLMGCLAASLAKNHMIGYRADFPVHGVIADINAFALGALWMDPYAKVKLVWATRKDRDWEQELRDAGCHIISGIDLKKANEPTRKYGLYQVFEPGSQNPDGSVCNEETIVNLAVPVSNWGKFYEQLVLKEMDGSLDARKAASKDKAVNYWWGMSSGIVDVVTPDYLPYASKKAISKFRTLLIEEEISPFEGEIHTQDGILKGPGTPRLTDNEIITMDWLCDNIIGEIPETSELFDGTQKVVKASGVKEERVENTGGR